MGSPDGCPAKCVIGLDLTQHQVKKSDGETRVAFGPTMAIVGIASGCYTEAFDLHTDIQPDPKSETANSIADKEKNWWTWPGIEPPTPCLQSNAIALRKAFRFITREETNPFKPVAGMLLAVPGCTSSGVLAQRGREHQTEDLEASRADGV